MFQNLYDVIRKNANRYCCKAKVKKTRSKKDKKPIQNLSMLRISSSTFYEAIKFSIKLAQWLSFFPITLNKSSKKELKFTWFHWRVAYALFTCLFFIIDFILLIYCQCCLNKKLGGMIFTAVVVFYLTAIVQYILFFKFTMDFPKFVKDWNMIEVRMTSYNVFSNLRITLNCITSSLMFLAAVEHTLVNAYKLIKCLRIKPDTSEALKMYFVKHYHIFNIIEYSIWTGLLVQFSNLQRTFIWNYGDVFIMIISTALKFRLKQMSIRLKEVCHTQVGDIGVFKSLRKDYYNLAQLCDKVNNRISLMVVVCFAANIFFILYQLFNSLKRIENTVEKVYFYMSFGLILLRTACLCILGGEVFEEWKNIAISLFSVKSSAYSDEVERFNNQVVAKALAIKGMNLFSVTRNLILKIAGVTVTYELALIQYNSEALKQDNY